MSSQTTWIEVIRLRSAAANLHDLIDRIAASVIDRVHPDGPLQIRLYRNPAVGTDLSIHLHLQTDGDRTPVDDTGARLARALEDYGLVDRTLWIEAQTAKGRTT